MTQDVALREQQIARFTRILAIVAVFLAALPALIGWMSTPPGGSYLGYQFSTDDQMVYAAWIRQAMDGQFLMDNRFTTDAQPGLTVHLYFWLLGQPARLMGIAWVETLARLGFTFLSVILLSRLIGKMQLTVFAHKLALALSIFGGGIGFLCWQVFGVSMSRPNLLSGVMGGRLPTDVWQPEGFVFPSMLTTSLFVMSLCLILGLLICVIEARETKKVVGWGALLFALLMNVHSYDVLIIALVLCGLLGAAIASKSATKEWVGRVALMSLGAIPPALWFMHVYRQDAVFQARAATPTWSPNLIQVIAGYLPLLVCAGLAILTYRKSDSPKGRWGFALFAVLVVVLVSLSASAPGDAFFLNWVGFGLAITAGICAVALMARPCPTFNLLTSWMVLGLILPYIPMLFQRKLFMAYAVPLGILAAVGLAQWLEGRERNKRNLSTALAIMICSGSSMLWFQREVTLIRGDVSRTTTHPVYLRADVLRIINKLNTIPNPKFVAAMPGLNAPTDDPDVFPTPYMPDLNTIVSGLTGATTYAGHWSETPEYGRKRSRLYTPQGREPSLGLFGTAVASVSKQDMLRQMNPNGLPTYLIVPVPDTFDQLPIADLRSLGQPIVEGPRFWLIKVTL